MMRAGMAEMALPDWFAEDVVDDVVNGVDVVPGAERDRDDDPVVAIARAGWGMCLGTGLLRLITSESLSMYLRLPMGPTGPGM